MTDYGSLLEDPTTQGQAMEETYYESTNIQQQNQIHDENEQVEEEDDDEDIKDIHHDLFGSDDDDNENENKTQNQTLTHNTNDPKIISKEYTRSVPEGKKLSISTNLSLSSLPQPTDFEFCILRLPNVIGCETEQFDDKSYVEPSSTSSIENYIRWRTHFDEALEETFKESNTKLVLWKDGTKSLFIGKDCYDIDEHVLNGNRDFIYAGLQTQTNNTSYKLCHGQFIKRLNVKATSQKSYKTLQKNLAKKHERTKGSKQLTAAQRRNNRISGGRGVDNGKVSKGKRKKLSRKRTLDRGYLEQGAHGGSSDENGMPNRKRRRQGSESEDDSDGSEEESDENYSESESDEDEEDDQPIGNRF